jgi:hypothetical protein
LPVWPNSDGSTKRRPRSPSCDANLAIVEGNLTRLYRSREDVDHIIDGLRKAGFE